MEQESSREIVFGNDLHLLLAERTADFLRVYEVKIPAFTDMAGK
jgi:hypothetical protein